MSWRKYFTPVPTNTNATGSYSPFSFARGTGLGPAAANYSSHLPDVYVGNPNRIERYGQYNTMDNDSEVNAALDILAEFCTQKNKENNTPFKIQFNNAATNSEIQILGQYLKQWCKINEFETRMFKIIRNIFKYGDQFFIRDPETKKWFHVDPANLTKIIVNESEGKKPEQYIIRDLNIAYETLSATKINTTNAYGPGGNQPGYQTMDQKYMTGRTPDASTSRFMNESNETAVNAEHVVHVSLSEGLDNNFPFGNSLLESIFKVYKQKELLEDAIIIYRVQRAPERRVFYVDVGNMPSHLAMQFVERVKTEIHQRRIPSKTGGGTNVIDSTYNPLSINEDYFFPQTAEGRGSKVETLPGGTNLGEIDDLRYFTNKLVRGLRIPSSYLPTGADDSASQYNDGRVGTAYIQELRFNNYCERLQSLVAEVFNAEFKLYLTGKGVNIDVAMFDLKFQPPQNFASYRQAELDSNRINTFTALQQIPFISNRFALQRFLGLSKEEIAENERLWKEENDEMFEGTEQDASAQMRGAGITGADISNDLGAAEGEVSPDVEADVPADTSPIGGAAPASPSNQPFGT
jgi:Bacteriophage T4-like portal protein (Gp20)